MVGLILAIAGVVRSVRWTRQKLYQQKYSASAAL